jgi:UDPglucose--hexose-1-phosphate uridylyltransferase
VSQRRVDPLALDTVWIASQRQSRPNLPASGCPFCVGGLEAPEPYSTRWFANRWPAMPDQRCEVLLYTPRHDAALWELGDEGVAAVVELWAERTAFHGARDDVASVLAFENRGQEVGATIAHPHGQLYAFAAVPARQKRLFSSSQSPSRQIEPAVLDGRTVARSGPWTALVPFAPRWPYSLLIASSDAAPDLVETPSADRAALAAVLREVTARLDALFAAPMPYMLWVNQRPFDGASWAVNEMSVEIAPLFRSPGTPRYVAAAEVATEEYFDPIDPADAARALRELSLP